MIAPMSAPHACQGVAQDRSRQLRSVEVSGGALSGSAQPFTEENRQHRDQPHKCCWDEDHQDFDCGAGHGRLVSRRSVKLIGRIPLCKYTAPVAASTHLQPSREPHPGIRIDTTEGLVDLLAENAPDLFDIVSAVAVEGDVEVGRERGRGDRPARRDRA